MIKGTMNYNNICDSCEHQRNNLDKGFCLKKEIELTGEVKECDEFHWIEDFGIIPEPKIEVKTPEPLTTIPENLVTVKVPEKPEFKIDVSTWEKIYYLYSKYKEYFGLLVKLTPIILTILKIISYFNSQKKNKLNEDRK